MAASGGFRRISPEKRAIVEVGTRFAYMRGQTAQYSLIEERERMRRLVRPLADGSLSPSAPDAQRDSSSALKLVQPRPDRRDRRIRPVAILKIARFWPSLQRSDTAGLRAAGVQRRADDLDAFDSESVPADAAFPQPVSAPSKPEGTAIGPGAVLAAKWIAVVLLTGGVLAAAVIEYQRRVVHKVVTGSLSVETVPAGLDVLIAGKNLGRTPLTLSLAPGTYDMQLGLAEGARTIKVNVAAGTSTVQHVEMAPPQNGSATDEGALRIHTEPSKLPVFVDGVERGVSPLTVEKIEPGDHDVTVRTERGALRRTVKVQPRETVSLIISSAIAPVDPAAVSAGWLTVTASVPLQLREGGKVIGSTDSDRVMLAAGDHDLELLNDALGFRAQRKVHVNAGKTTTTRIDLPNGTMSLNASPWAEVFVDGERIGETPIGNLSRPIGRHEVIFRHPELGERREIVTVTVQQPARLGVDLRKK